MSRTGFVKAYCLVAILGMQVAAFSWGSGTHKVEEDSVDTSRHLPPQSLLPNTYAIALSELQEMEAEPLCHRNAARLLVSHCRVLDGKDEATVLTDSGRLARDFVDSYAASLAICDLERGSFRISSSCSNFQEAALAKLDIPTKPRLHVTTSEIDRCLEGLAQSDSAWNTWVSYRHKALRFCEAARADNEKDQHIQVFKRVTKILNQLTDDVQLHLATKSTELESFLERAAGHAGGIGSQLHNVNEKLEDLDKFLATRILNTAEDSGEIIRRTGLQAKSLEDLLTAIVQNAVRGAEEMAISHETAIQDASVRSTEHADLVTANLAAALASSASLQRELVNSQLKSEEMLRRQSGIEEGMRHLESYVEAVSTRHEEHNERLREAQGRTDEILGTLDSIVSSATSYKSLTASSFSFFGWWPYIYCPIGSLVLGSYGLQPSGQRNILLIASGEILGFLVSSFAHYSTSLFSAVTTPDSETKPIAYKNASSPKVRDCSPNILSIEETHQSGRPHFI